MGRFMSMLSAALPALSRRSSVTEATQQYRLKSSICTVDQQQTVKTAINDIQS